MNMIIRLDTFFIKDFMVGAYVKSMRNTMSRLSFGYSWEFHQLFKRNIQFLDLTKLSPDSQHKISMILLIPDIMEKVMPANFEEVLLKRNTDFKMKGFMFTPLEIDEKTISTISIKDKVYSSFKDSRHSKIARRNSKS